MREGLPLTGRAGIEAICGFGYASDDQTLLNAKMCTITVGDLRNLLAEADGLRIGWWNWMKAQGASDAAAIAVLREAMCFPAPSAAEIKEAPNDPA